MKILICEDNPMAMKTLSVILEREGFDADVAEDGNEGIEMLQKNDYDLLVIDIHLPYRSGLELIKFVRSEQGKDTPSSYLLHSATTRCSVRQESWDQRLHSEAF